MILLEYNFWYIVPLNLALYVVFMPIAITNHNTLEIGYLAIMLNVNGTTQSSIS